MNGSISIKSIKLEQGTVSTLANEVVDYAAELRKCQRYFCKFTNIPYYWAAGTFYAPAYSLPEMRIIPTVKISRQGVENKACNVTGDIIYDVNNIFEATTHRLPCVNLAEQGENAIFLDVEASAEL